MLAPRQYRDQRRQVFSYQARPPPQRGRSCYHQSARPRFPPAPGPGPGHFAGFARVGHAVRRRGV